MLPCSGIVCAVGGHAVPELSGLDAHFGTSRGCLRNAKAPRESVVLPELKVESWLSLINAVQLF